MLIKIIILVIIFSQVTFAEIKINEIMADPDPCDDKYCEWIELYNDNESSINVSGWKFSDDNSEDYFDRSFYGNEDIIIPGKYYAIIVDSDSRVQHNFDIDDDVIWIYVNDVMGGSNLNNNGENITLYDVNEGIVDSITYEQVNPGYTWALVNETWQKSEPTPGRSNEDNESYNNDYSVIKINEFLPDPKGDDDANIPDGEWVELYNEGAENLDLLGFKLEDNSSHEIIISDVRILENTTLIKANDYLVVYMNGFFGFLNNDGYENIKLYDLNDNLIDNVSYSNSKEGISWNLIDGVWQYSLPSPNEINLGNESVETSILEIKEVYGLDKESAKWGDIIRIKLNIYKADTIKNSIKAWVEDGRGYMVSEETSMNFYGKNSDYNLIIPIKIRDNCDNKFKDGSYKIFVSGLDAKDSSRIKIGGNNCNDIKEKSEVVNMNLESRAGSAESETVIYHKNGVLYQSKGNEASRYALFFLSGISILLLIYFIFKNGNQGKDNN